MLLPAAPNPDHPGEGDILACAAKARLPVSGKWATQANRHGSVPSQSAVSIETANKRIAGDMSVPLSGTPDGRTRKAQAANACLTTGELPNITPNFITGVSGTCSFLAWLRASCPGCLMAKLKGENLMVVPSIADGFIAAFSAMRSPVGKDGLFFCIFTQSEDRLLVKNLGRGTPQSVVREQL